MLFFDFFSTYQTDNNHNSEVTKADLIRLNEPIEELKKYFQTYVILSENNMH